MKVLKHFFCSESVNLQEASAPGRSESVMAEIDGLQDEVDSLEKKVGRLEKALELREESAMELSGSNFFIPTEVCIVQSTLYELLSYYFLVWFFHSQ